MAQVIEGLGTTLTLGSATMEFVTLSAPGLDGGEALDATTLSNTEWMTRLPQTLKDVPNMSFTGNFIPSEWDSWEAEINVNQSIVISFEYQTVDLDSITFWGYLKSFTPDAGEVGTTWRASSEIVATNMNSSYVETGPVYAAGASASA